jgi:hypothetical protein
MKSVLIAVLATFILQPLRAQHYNITTDKNDPFSLALVKILNDASTRFADCKGDSIRSTWLMGDDHKLSFDFPGSSIAIIRSRDWDRSAYIEFRGFSSVNEVSKGIRSLIAKIKNALGSQLVPPIIHGDTATILQIAGLSIKDQHGYFTPHFELFPGASSADPYLLGPEKEEDGLPKKYFILLKVQGGVPSYQYYVPANIVSPDFKLTQTLQQLMKAAAADFDSLPGKRLAHVAMKKKKTDTLLLNGYTVLINQRGSNYTTSILFPAPVDSVAFNEQWDWCNRAVQSATGSRYVYHHSYLGENHFTSYYAIKYNEKDPRIYIEHLKGNDYPSSPISIKVISTRNHQVKRGLSSEDFD